MAAPLKLAISYFTIVFSAGFVLGVVRTLWLIPVLGERTAELVELPLMVAIYTAVAFCLVRRWQEHLTLANTAVAGVAALLLLLAIEIVVVLRLRGLTIGEYLDARDWLAGSAYLLTLMLFAAMPSLAWLKRRQTSRLRSASIVSIDPKADARPKY